MGGMRGGTPLEAGFPELAILGPFSWVASGTFAGGTDRMKEKRRSGLWAPPSELARQ